MANNAAVNFSWSPNNEPDLAGYRIYYGLYPGIYIGFNQIPFPGVVSAQMVASNPQGSFSYPFFKYDGLWYFAIAAYDLGGNESALSTPQTRRVIMVDSKIVRRKI